MNTDEDKQYWQRRDFVLELLKRLPSYVFWKNRESVYLGCNNAFAQAVGLSCPEEIIGKTDYDLPVKKEESDAYREDDRQVMESRQPKLNIEEYQTLSNKRQIVLSTSKVPLFNKEGKVMGILCIYHDITAYKQMEKDLREANPVKTQFIQNMQHDIRTPTTGILAMLASLAEQETDPDKRSKLVMLKNSANQLLNICNAVIDFDKIEHGKIPLINKKINIHKLASAVIELNQAAAEHKYLALSLQIDPNVPPILKGDDFRISRILINLIGNAVKFTNQGTILLTIKLVNTSEEKTILQFGVHDTGIGIPPDKKVFIYEKFNRINPANQGIYKGSGLGLNIVKQFVEELEGDIEVQSEINKGTNFYVTLAFQNPLSQNIHDDEFFIPAEESKEEKIIADLQSINNTTIKTKDDKLLVLLVEDEPLARIATQCMLQKENCDVQLATDVSSAKILLSKLKFDFVMTDIGLPDGSGIDIIQAIKNNKSSINYPIPFFALTAHVDQRKLLEIRKAGFNVALSKPLAEDQLHSLLKKYFNSAFIQPTAADTSIIFDFEATKRFFNGNGKLANEIFDILLKNLPEDVIMLKKAEEENNIESAREILHKLAGGLAYCIVPRLHKAVLALQNDIKKTQSLENCKSLFLAVYDEMELLLKHR